MILILKRIFDIVCALLGLILLSPVMLIIALLIKFSKYSTHGPIIFKQQRIGQYQIPFYIHKFRTMVVNSVELGEQISTSTDFRITRLGILLRKTKLDELPQLFDVLCGYMSLVGPRPEVAEYVALYPEHVKQIIFSVKPGITDWASIVMIDEGSILAKADNPKTEYIQNILPKKLDFAVKYVKTRTFMQDLLIIFTTIVNIFRPHRFKF